jgi:hypothetical protein
MGFPRPFFCFIKSDNERNSDIRNRLNVNNLTGDKSLPKELVRPPGRNGEKPLTQTRFLISTPGMTGCLKTQETAESSRTP